MEHSGIEYFEKETTHGLSGQLFCRGSAKQIVAMLLDECRRLHVEVMLKADIWAVKHKSAGWIAKSEAAAVEYNTGSSGFALLTSQGKFTAETLVVATGGLSIPSLGGSGMGYELAESFQLRKRSLTAALVPFTFTDAMLDICNTLAGVSTEVVLFNERQSFREDILFTHRGLSGPAALQLSSYWNAGESITVNLLPGHDVPKLFRNWKQEHAKSLLRTNLDRELPRKLVLELEKLWWPEFVDTALAEWPVSRLDMVSKQFEQWILKPAGTEGYRTAEVTLGGIDTRDLSSKTMESIAPGLFFIGEVVDVTGHLGGFNFQWAWSSGYAAGKAV